MGTDGTFPDFLSCGRENPEGGGDRGIPPLRKRPRKDGAPGKVREKDGAPGSTLIHCEHQLAV